MFDFKSIRKAKDSPALQIPIYKSISIEFPNFKLSLNSTIKNSLDFEIDF